MRARPLVLIPCLLVGLAGCGGGDDPGSTTTRAAPGSTTVISTTIADGATTSTATTVDGATAGAEPEPSRGFFVRADREASRLITLFQGTDAYVLGQGDELTAIRDRLRRALTRARAEGETSPSATALLADATAAVEAAAARDATRLPAIRESTRRHRLAFNEAFVAED